MENYVIAGIGGGMGGQWQYKLQKTANLPWVVSNVMVI